ncbi:MAG: purine-binding chemotaxis protein CheW [Myxococcales bacterium]|nr:purine-binding chemotaxis protein CheW [Myxococcales bacterium]
MSRVQVVRFEVGQQHYALDVMAVKEVVLPRVSQPVPGQPDFLEGLVEMRGEYVPLVDLRKRFGANSPVLEGRVLVLSCLRRELAFLVDSVGEVQWLEEGDMRAAPLDTSVGASQAVASIADVNGVMVLLLRSEAILTEDEWERILPI